MAQDLVIVVSAITLAAFVKVVMSKFVGNSAFNDWTSSGSRHGECGGGEESGGGDENVCQLHFEDFCMRMVEAFEMCL